ncbi:MAG: glycoside hydrolase family 38 C-terminal domain-containing protein [Clostridia bacterium]|nr:glycoside hydrolase family 38 C-terminal domain-containing protein [Clostridia bacterium]
MKKILCLWLSFFLILSCAVGLAAEKSESYTTDIETKLEILEMLAIINPREPGVHYKTELANDRELGEYGVFRNISKSGFLNYIWEKIDGKWYNINIPALGSAKLEGGIESCEVERENTGELENELIRVELDADGAVISVYDKLNKRETLTEKSNLFTVYFDDGNAWDFSESYRDFAPKYFRLVKEEGFTDGPVCGIRQEYEYSKSRLWQTITVKEGSPMVEFDVRVDWKECNRMLRTAFNTSVNASEVCCDIQYGYRSIYRQDFD